MLKKTLLALSALSALSPAQAHVVFGSPNAKAGAFHVADLRIFHGCEGSPTTEVTLTIPDGVTRVRPRAVPGWTVSIEMKQLDKPLMLHGAEVTETVGSVTWKGGSLPDFAYQEFEVHMMMPHHAEGGALSFPVTQLCEKGRLDWTEKALDEATFRTLEAPAPYITLD